MSASPREIVTGEPAAPAHSTAFAAVRWALLCATATGGVWALALTAASALLDFSVQPSDLDATPAAALLAGGITAAVGLVAGSVVGLLRGGEQRLAWAVGLGTLGVLAGSIGGGLSVPAIMLLRDSLDPIVSSALAWTLAGLAVGPIGQRWSRWLHPPAPPDDEDDPPRRRVEWLLRQDDRRLRDRPLLRVFPVLAASAPALIGAAALAPSLHALSLAAVGVLGSAVALVLMAQERRQRGLDARLRALEYRRRDTSEDAAPGA